MKPKTNPHWVARLSALGVCLAGLQTALAGPSPGGGGTGCTWGPWTVTAQPTIGFYYVDAPTDPVPCCKPLTISAYFSVQGSYELTRKEFCNGAYFITQTNYVGYYLTNFLWTGIGTIPASGNDFNTTFIPKQNGDLSFSIQAYPGTAVGGMGIHDYNSELYDTNYVVSASTNCSFTTFQPATRLGYWRFWYPSWMGQEGQMPYIANDVRYFTAWDAGAALMDQADSVLGYDAVGYCLPNITRGTGSISFWYSPTWTTGAGPGNLAKLIEMAPNANWYLCVDSTGSHIMMVSKGDADSSHVTNLSRSIDWVAGQWHQIVATYSPSYNDVAIYVDGERLKDHAYTNVDAASVTSFTIGNGADGTSPAYGAFDQIETYNYVLSSTEIQSLYQEEKPRPNLDTDGDGVPDTQDCYPLDPNRWDCSSLAGAPIIQLLQPVNAISTP